MPTTYIIDPPLPEPLDDLDAFMAELDKELKRTAKKPVRSTTTAPTAAILDPIPMQMWFPHSVAFHMTRQYCLCGSIFEAVNGLFLVNQHRNGALRSTRHAPREAIPADFAALPRLVRHDQETVELCSACFESAIPIAPAANYELIRAIPASTDDDTGNNASTDDFSQSELEALFGPAEPEDLADPLCRTCGISCTSCLEQETLGIGGTAMWEISSCCGTHFYDHPYDTKEA